MKFESLIPLMRDAAKSTFLGAFCVFTGLSAASENSSVGLLLRDVQNELILGTEFSPVVAACLDEEMSYAWVLSTRTPHQVSERTTTRLQRAREICVSASDGKDPLRATTRAVQKVFADNLEARRRMDANKVEVRACMESSRDATGFRGCLTRKSLVRTEDPAWSRWMGLYELFSSNRALSRAFK